MALMVVVACASPTAAVAPGGSPDDGSELAPGIFDDVGIGPAGTESFEALARIFYSRVTNRRFSSIATYYDPALREFFSSPEAFADYFADLVESLIGAHFRAERPTSVVLKEIEVEAPSRIKVTVRFEGDNALPLRWWKVKMLREDWWEHTGDRWWIIPGKL
jgi:hypothetical protein